MTQLHVTLPQLLVSEGQNQKTSILVDITEASWSSAFWTHIDMDNLQASFCSKDLKAFSKKGDSMPTVVTDADTATQRRHQGAMWGEQQSSGENPGLPDPHLSSPKGHPCLLKRLPHSATSQFRQKTPSSPRDSPVAHQEVLIFPRKCLSLHWLKHFNEAHEEKAYESQATQAFCEQWNWASVHALQCQVLCD